VGFAPIGALLDQDDYSQEASAQYLLRLASGIRHARTAAGARTFLFTGVVPESGTTTMVEKLGRQLRNLNLTTLTLAATSIDGKISYVTTSSSNTRTQAIQSSAHILSSGNLGLGAADALAVKLTPSELTPSTSIHGAALVTRILEEVRDEYDVVLLDASPLLISADTEYLARIADATVLVAQSGRTTRNQLLRAAKVLERLNVPGVSVALNRIERKHIDAALASDIGDFQRQLSRQRALSPIGASN
jgi:polysaccharide biosynthesis transport protein